MGKKFKKIKILALIVVLFFAFILFPKPSEVDKFYPNNTSLAFQNLLKNDEYQVFVFDTPLNYPINFARHPWFVLNEKGKVSRWEVRMESAKNGNHLRIDFWSPFQAMHLTFFGLTDYTWKPELLGVIDGGENSEAQRIIKFIKDSPENYPYQYRYSIFGPNSNSYLEWVLNKFPELNIEPSWRFVGKDFKIEERK